MGMLQVGGELQNIVGDGMVVDSSRVRYTDGEGNVGTLATAVSELQSAVSNNGGDTSAVADRCTALESKASQLEAKLDKVSTAFVYKGTVQDKSKLPLATADLLGHVYNIGEGEEKGANYVCYQADNGTFGWDKLSEDIAKADLTGYATEDAVNSKFADIMPMLMTSVSVGCSVSPSAMFVGQTGDVTVSGSCNVAADLTVKDTTNGTTLKTQAGVKSASVVARGVSGNTTYQVVADVLGQKKSSSTAKVNFHYPIYVFVGKEAELRSMVDAGVIGKLTDDHIVSGDSARNDEDFNKMLLYGPWANPNGRQYGIRYKAGDYCFFIMKSSVNMNYNNVKLPSGFGIGFEALDGAFAMTEGYKAYRTETAFGEAGETKLSVG